MRISLRNKNLLVYSAKCALGIILCTLLSRFLGRWIDYSWSLISVVLVLSPGGNDALELALTRIKANLVGGSIGILILLLLIPAPWNMAASAALSLYVCDRLGLNMGARSTLAAMIIILLRPEGAHPWDNSLDRVLAVVTGCLLGWGVTYVFHALVNIDAPATHSESVREDREG